MLDTKLSQAVVAQTSRVRLDPTADGTEAIDTSTDALVADTDGDGLTDGEEVEVYGTDPLFVDTDGDGVTDRAELDSGWDPLDPHA